MIHLLNIIKTSIIEIPNYINNNTLTSTDITTFPIAYISSFNYY